MPWTLFANLCVFCMRSPVVWNTFHTIVNCDCSFQRESIGLNSCTELDRLREVRTS
ncbi:hypothetical protein M758_5G152200 [Ceratodon purpureus]|nr:hypothetical protein M758_5G152200 [Ceratodon purpureus]